MVYQTPSYLAMEMARIRILKTGTEIMWHMHYLWDGLTKEVYLT